jgi:hypothetical protein
MAFGLDSKTIGEATFSDVSLVTQKVRGLGNSGLNTATGEIIQLFFRVRSGVQISPNYEASQIKG